MSITIETFLNHLEVKVPLNLSIPSDKNGLKIGNAQNILHRVIGTLELTDEVVQYAIDNEVNLICLHHDPLYVALKYIRSDNQHEQLIMKLIAHDITVYVAHTNLDAVDGGLNDFMYNMLEGENAQILDATTRIGRYGAIRTPMPLGAYLETVIEPLQKTARIIADDKEKIIATIAVVSGSGSDFYQIAKEKSVDLFITGDIDYHTAMLAKEDGFAILDIGHDFERIVEMVWRQLFFTIKKENDYDFNIFEKEFAFIPWENV